MLCFGIYTFIEHKKADHSTEIGNIQAGNNDQIDEQNTDQPVKTDPNQEENPNHKTEQPDDNDTIVNTPNESEGNNNVAPEVDVAFATSIDNIAMLVNPTLSLPENYVPDDLVYPDVRFIFKEKIEKRMLREEAARALETMFEAAEKDGIYLAGVSGYRSHETQKQLFKFYVDRDGYEKAKTYSAEPGTSEHETGLAIDISGSTGKCAAQDCFADTVEAVWLAENSAQYGFIIRYPKGKEHITGYKHEPWHLRYVGKEVAIQIFEEDLTLEEYYGM